MGGRTSQTQTSQQTTSLPQDQQTNVNMLMAGARDFYRTGGPQYYGGNTVAGTNDQQIAGRNAATGYAGGQGLNFIQNYQNGESTFLNPANIMNPDNMPGFARAKQGVVADATNNLTRNILPSIRGGAVADGAYGGSRQGIAEGLAAAETSRGIGDTLARMDMDAYGQGLQAYNNAANRAPSTYGLGLAPSQTQMQVGGMYQNDQQRQIDADMSRWNFNQMSPLVALQALQQLTGNMGQYGGTTAGTQTQTQSGGGWQQGLGLALSLASMLPTGGASAAAIPALGGWGSQAMNLGMG
jgi:hypothetical protein